MSVIEPIHLIRRYNSIHVTNTKYAVLVVFFVYCSDSCRVIDLRLEVGWIDG